MASGGGWIGFIGKSGSKGLEGWMRKSGWTGFGVLEFVCGIYVGIIELRNCVKKDLHGIIAIHAW